MSTTMIRSKSVLGSLHAAAAFAMLMSACSGQVGVGSPEGSGGAAPGTGGSANTGGSSGGSAGSSSGGSAGQGTGGSAGSGGTGTGGGGGGGPAVPFAPAAGGFKRLTTTQFQNSLTDLLGSVTFSDLEPDMWVHGFATVGAATIPASPRGVEQYQDAINTVTQQAFADKARRDALIGCTPSATDSACAASFVTKFGQKAWRQPLTAAQTDRYKTLAADLTKNLGDPVEALRLVANAMLQSPYFLYRLERGEPAPSTSYWKYTAQEMASRLSFFITNSTPDALTLAAADKGDLNTREGVQAEAERLFASPRGRASISNFAAELFQVAIIGARAKDSTMFPAYTPELQVAMEREVPEMLAALVFDQKADALEMFTTHKTFANKNLAALYGVPTTGMTADTWKAITLPADGPRAGILGSAGFLSLYASQKEGSPTIRGKFIRNMILCEDIPPPPGDVSTVIPDPPPGTVLTKREKLELHRSKASCAGCHSLMDPLGLPLETFDAIGGLRTTDNGKTMDLTGDIDGTTFNGPAELGRVLASNPATAACLATNIYRYASGHAEVESEQAVINQLVDGFNQSGHDLRALMTQVVTSDGFRFVAPPTQ